MTTTLAGTSIARLLELRVEGRITPESARGFLEPLQEALALGEPVRVLYDRRTVSAPTAEGRAVLRPFLLEWARVAPLVLAWADVYDPRRCASLRRAAAARAARGQQQRSHGYPYGLFEDLAEARAWLATQPGSAQPGSAQPGSAQSG